MEQLYVISDDRGDGRPRLLGILTKEGDNITFEYKLNGKIEHLYQRIVEFPDATKKYEGEKVLEFIERIIPRMDHISIGAYIKKAGLTSYDEWGLLKYYGHLNFDGDAFVVEKLPENIVLLERI